MAIFTLSGIITAYALYTAGSYGLKELEKRTDVDVKKEVGVIWDEGTGWVANKWDDSLPVREQIVNAWTSDSSNVNDVGVIGKLSMITGNSLNKYNWEKQIEAIGTGELKVLCDPSNPDHDPSLIGTTVCRNLQYMDLVEYSNNLDIKLDELAKRLDNSNTNAILKGAGSIGLSAASGINEYVLKDNADYLNKMIGGVGSSIDSLSKGNPLPVVVKTIAGIYGGGIRFVGSAVRTVENLLSIDPQSGLGSFMVSIGEIIGLQSFNEYINGVDETIFGNNMEKSWSGVGGFLDYMRNNRSSIRFSKRTPLDIDDNGNEFGGPIILGLPPTFTNLTDPSERTYLNSFAKDATIISLTPGFPKFNGSQTMLTKNYYMDQTRTGEEALHYIKENGLSSNFNEKDKRYYSFNSDYSEYYAYLETMLNTVWIKMGLSEIEGSDGVYDEIFTFFDVVSPDGSINKERYKNGALKEKYKRPIGFFLEGSPSISESIDSSASRPGDMDRMNESSQNMRDLNYITGFGNNMTNYGRRAGGVMFAQQSNLADAFSGISKPTLNPKSWMGSAIDAYKFSVENDLGALAQTFMSSNGMNVTYPNLWNDTGYTKATSFEFNFVSPYGDPLSIFQYVYVPFLTLLTFAAPRQVAENGMVSPFLVRADIPGLFTSDLAMISSIQWNKGGNDNIWTVDKLPRAISGSFTVEDMYPYLAMTKRLSFMSSNPAYTSMLDNLAGLRALTFEDEDILNEYWDRVVSRVSGEKSGMWNNTREDKVMSGKFNSISKPKLGSSARLKSTPWIKKGSR